MKRKNRKLQALLTLQLLLAFVLTSCISTQVVKKPLDLTESKILDFGVVDENEVNYFPWKDKNGKEYVTEYPKFIEAKEVPAQLGTGFGIVYVINGKETRGNVEIVIKTEHPLMKGKTSYVLSKIVKLGQPKCFYFTFSEEAELVEGTFDFQIIYENKVLLRQKFTVVKPA